MLSLGAVSQVKKTVVIPGNGKIDVEQFRDGISTKTDISKLSLSELRVLRNGFAARQGYLFMNADLRDIFNQTSWYHSRMMKRWLIEEDGVDPAFFEEYEDDEYCEVDPKDKFDVKPIAYSKAESQFIDRIKAREEQLRQQNFRVGNGGLVNVDNVINPYQLADFSGALKQKLQQNGFAIVPETYDQLFQIYENNDYHDFPSFVTTDLYLQAFHLYFDVALREVEQTSFVPQLTSFLKQMQQQMAARAASEKDKNVKALAEWDVVYFAVAQALLTGEPLAGVPQNLRAQADEEVEKSIAATADFSVFLGYEDVLFPYQLFRPRGHYTRNEVLSRYFRAMMWLQTAPFQTDKPVQMQRAALIAEVMTETVGLWNTYNALCEPITFLLGEVDNVSMQQVQQIMLTQGLTVKALVRQPKSQLKFQQAVEAVAQQQTRIKPKHQATGEFKVNLMPQRYMPDAEVLLEMVDADSHPTKRGEPKGLDFFAAMGVSAAERILMKELNEAQRWDQFTPNLQRMKQRMKEIDWNATVANTWMRTLSQMTQGDAQYPYFMKTEAWDKKNLNAVLASWAELKHDAILYAKQPMVAECGGGGPDEPVVVGYVEPNVKFWAQAIELLNKTDETFTAYHLNTERLSSITTSLREQAEFLLEVSRKELAGKKLDYGEYCQIEIIGSTFEYISLQMVQGEDQYLVDWDDVQGADKKMALVADVFTANGMNNPRQSVVYEAVGPAHEIYVVVEIDGLLYLTRGAVFSYREFLRDVNAPRLTDEEWQQDLESMPNEGVPSWMQPLLIPRDDVPLDNERVFYSSGC